MPGGGPNWLSAWVRLNNKHVAYQEPPTGKGAAKSQLKDEETTLHSESTTPTVATPPKSSRIESFASPSSPSRGSGHNQKGDQQSISAQNEPLSPPNHGHFIPQRRNRRRLQNTRSASDLIREIASGDAVSRPSTTAVALHGGRFDANATESGMCNRSTAGKFLNETAFVAQLQQRQQASRSRDAGSVASAADVPVAAASSVGAATARSEPASSRSNRFINIKVGSPRSRHHEEVDQRREGSHAICDHCEMLQEELRAAQQDLDYMRNLATRKEQKGLSAVADASMEELGHHSRHKPAGPLSLDDNSKQLTEVTRRHKKQVEQLTRERVSTTGEYVFWQVISAHVIIFSYFCSLFVLFFVEQSRWQQETHLKLHKFANLSKDLNEEAAVRNENAISLQQELQEVKAERDEISEEVVRLRAQLLEYSKTEAEHEALRKRLVESEEERLRHVTEVAMSRDEVISELSSKLKAALDQLAIERARHQRRQIIFPQSMTTSPPRPGEQSP